MPKSISPISFPLHSHTQCESSLLRITQNAPEILGNQNRACDNIPSLEPSKHNVFKFAWIIRFIGLVRHLKMSFYHVLYICQYHRSSLYNVLFCTDIQWFFCSIIYFKNLACQCLTFTSFLRTLVKRIGLFT